MAIWGMDKIHKGLTENDLQDGYAHEYGNLYPGTLKYKNKTATTKTVNIKGTHIEISPICIQENKIMGDYIFQNKVKVFHYSRGCSMKTFELSDDLRNHVLSIYKKFRKLED